MAEVDALLSVVDRLLEQNAKLVSLIVDLKREGFTPPVPTAEFDGGGLPDAVVKAIGERSEEGSGQRAQLRGYAESRLRANVDPAAVADEILAGADVDALLGQVDEEPPASTGGANEDEDEEAHDEGGADRTTS